VRWVGYFGSLHPWHGADLLIDAFARVSDRIPVVNLLALCGGKKERLKAFRKRIRKRGLAERVTLMPPMQHQELAPFVAAMEYSFAPLDDTPRNTHQGCCPLKIVESMAAGTPVIASDLRVVRELLTDGVDGLLVRPNNKRALAVAIAQALKDQGRQKQLSQAARKRANERFTNTTISSNLREVFSNVASLNAANKEE
jgi:glycosyltransferase involved in cell wall biosynthesis